MRVPARFEGKKHALKSTSFEAAFKASIHQIGARLPRPIFWFFYKRSMVAFC
jgi:hypothetical protein